MWRQINGTTLKVMAMVGIVLLTMLALIFLSWLVKDVLGYDPDTVVEVFISLFTLLGIGLGGAKYVGSHEVKKKDSDG